MALLLSSDLLPFSQRGVRLDAELGEGLDRLKTERHVNLISWVRSAPWVETLGSRRWLLGIALRRGHPRAPR